MSKGKTLLWASLVAGLAGTVMPACGTNKSGEISGSGGSAGSSVMAGSSGGTNGGGGDDGANGGAAAVTSHKVTIVGSGT
jgi:hypothetical protein